MRDNKNKQLATNSRCCKCYLRKMYFIGTFYCVLFIEFYCSTYFISFISGCGFSIRDNIFPGQTHQIKKVLFSLGVKINRPGFEKNICSVAAETMFQRSSISRVCVCVTRYCMHQQLHGSILIEMFNECFNDSPSKLAERI